MSKRAKQPEPSRAEIERQKRMRRLVSLRGLPRTDAVEPEISHRALLAEIAALEELLDEALEANEQHRPIAAAGTAEERAELGGLLVSEARKMLPRAVKNAKEGKPALLRLLHKIADPKSRS